MKKVFARHPLLAAAFVLAVALTLFFAAQFVARVIYWSNPAHRNQQVQPWMTVGYIGRSWGLSAVELDDLAGLPRPQGHPLTLEQIARDRGIPVAEVVAQVEAAIAVLIARNAEKEAGPPPDSPP